MTLSGWRDSSPNRCETRSETRPLLLVQLPDVWPRENSSSSTDNNTDPKNPMDNRPIDMGTVSLNKMYNDLPRRQTTSETLQNSNSKMVLWLSSGNTSKTIHKLDECRTRHSPSSNPLLPSSPCSCLSSPLRRRRPINAVAPRWHTRRHKHGRPMVMWLPHPAAWSLAGTLSTIDCWLLSQAATLLRQLSVFESVPKLVLEQRVLRRDDDVPFVFANLLVPTIG
mmetsp:Transcript_1513/g.4556  ORF Transcript_1513/g.4556 Transcript_1513/m.4556 type:complete len:224 (-) Transcript_1513:907-1578(-)